MSTEIIITTGATGGHSNRLEIHDLIQDERQFSLYIQALLKICQLPQDHILSFFQTGGIHGLPPIPWDASGGLQPSGDWKGYCSHGTVIFPTWHRPYMCLFEQILQQKAIEIAKQYGEDRQLWEEAARDLRAPYWDWALKDAVPPAEVISEEYVSIITPDGPSEVVNPLVRYRFHPIDQSFPAPFHDWEYTLRHPTNETPKATSNIDELKKTLIQESPSIRSRLWHMFAYLHDWTSFSNHSASHARPNDSLEGIHDSIHNNIGGAGHVGDPAVAGFDPIFFLHHANVDRLLALWTAINPDFKFTSGSAEGGTWTIKPDATVDENTPLTPFRREAPDLYWESSGIFLTEKLGYTYPDFNGLDLSDKERVKEAIQKRLKSLYEDPQPSMASGQISVIHDWTVRVRVKKYELRRSFNILFFFGTPDGPRFGPSYVGSYNAFVNSAVESCANCRNLADGGLVIQGFVHLNDKIAQHASELHSFDPAVIEPYLQDRLSWRVELVDGTTVPFEDIPSLEITVSATPLTLHPQENFPRAGETHWHHAITRGRRGGYPEN